MSYKAINWNKIEDILDKATWEKLTEQFWLDTRIPISNDIDDWRKLSQQEKDLVAKVFGGLTLLDTLQSEVGANILLKDARTQQEEAIYNNISFMECYTKDHKLLTPSGWEPIADINVGDTVMVYDKDSETIYFSKVTTTSNHIADKIYKFSTNLLDLRVSPGHRMYYEESVIKKNHKHFNKYHKQTITAEEFVDIPKTSFYRIPTIKPYIDGNDNELTSIEEFLIAYQADGSLSQREIKRYNQWINNDDSLISQNMNFKFSFTKQRKIDELYRIVTMINGAIITENEPSPGTSKAAHAKRNFTVQIPFSYLPDNFATTDNIAQMVKEIKNFWNWFNVRQLTSDKALKIIESVSKWDSHDARLNPENNYNTVTYSTTNQKNQEFVHAVATLAGLPCTVSVRIDDRKESYKNEYICRVQFSEHKRNIQTQSLSIETLPAEMVYGVEVDTGYLFVNAGRTTIISGNCVHAKSYSSIFSTLLTPKEIEDVFEWTNTDSNLQYKADTVNDIYQNGTPIQKKIASVLLESFLFYSGFYTPLYYLGNNKLPNVAEVIKLILRDENVHGTYIGYKAQLAMNEMPEDEYEETKAWAYDLLYDLYENEIEYTHKLYDSVGWTDDVIIFLEYNANKALMNLGLDPLFSTTEQDVNPIVMNGISTSTSNHDFFSQVGNGYLLGQVEAMQDDDYNYGK